MGCSASSSATESGAPKQAQPAVQEHKSDATSTTTKHSGDEQQPALKVIADTIAQDASGPHAEPMKITSRGFNKSKGGSTLFSENSGYQ